MNYLLLVCSDGVPTPEKTAAMRSQIPAWLGEMDGRGVRRFEHQLEPASTAVSLRVRDGETLISDGPFAESKEFVAGFDIIDCADLDAAIDVAATHPVAQFHSIEVRPFAENPPSYIGPADHSAIGEKPADRQRYLLLMCLDGIPASDDEEEAISRDIQVWHDETTARGVQVYGHPLGHAETATTVRVRDGETLISDGPFVETKEFIGGFDIVDCASRQAAIELAAAHPLARYHVVEVRPFSAEE